MLLSWLCDNCSCNNDDEVNECFVCGEHRSAESIRLARIRAIEKKRDAFNEQLYNKTTFISKLLLIVVGVLFVIGGIIKIAQGTILVDFERNFLQTITTAKENILTCDFKSFGVFCILNVKENSLLIGRCLSEFNIDLLKNSIMQTIVLHLGENISELGTKLIVLLPNCDKFTPLIFTLNNSLNNFLILNSNLNCVTNHGIHSGSLVFDKATTVYQIVANNISIVSAIVKEMLDTILYSIKNSIDFLKHIATKHKT